MTELEERLRRYAQPSSDSERERQERAERMIRAAIDTWPAFERLPLDVFAKGSYPNRTNVRLDSDVDIAVVQKRIYYMNDGRGGSLVEEPQGRRSGVQYVGLEFRSQVEQAIRQRFKSLCDTTGNTAITIRENTSHVNADVVPSFPYRHYYVDGLFQKCHHGTAVQRKDGTWVVNYPKQQLDNGDAKNQRTFGRYKRVVRILKRVENDLVEAGIIEELASFFIECLAYNVPAWDFLYLDFHPLTPVTRTVLTTIHESTVAGGGAASWLEVNGIKPLFADGQSWNMSAAHTFAEAALAHLGLH